MAADPQDAPRHAGQVVRRVLLRRNIAIDPETALLVAAAVQAALQASTPSRPPRRRPRVPPSTASRCSDMVSSVCCGPISGMICGQSRTSIGMLRRAPDPRLRNGSDFLST